jgi:hypothetical protein
LSAILRHRHPNRFTVLPNNAIRNPALSFRAVGVLAHLLSLPDGAKIDSATLASAHKEGRDAVRSAFSELAEHGYYRRDVIRLPDGTLRTEVVVSSSPMNGERPDRTDAGKSGVGPGPENPAPVEPAPVNPTSAGPTPVDQATTAVPTTQDLIPPQPPRPAGGQQVDVGRAGPRLSPPEPEVRAGTPEPQQATMPLADEPRRQAGTNPRARGANPRAEAELAEAARLEAEAAARQAELERRVEARRAADEAAEREAQRLEAEALALSAALDDQTLAGIVSLVSVGMAGPLARSPLAISRAVVTWCRAAAAAHAGPLAEAVYAGLAARLVAGEGTASGLLDLPAAAPGTPPLRRRIAQLLNPDGVA